MRTPPTGKQRMDVGSHRSNMGFSLALGRGRWAVVSKDPNARGALSRYHLTL